MRIFPIFYIPLAFLTMGSVRQPPPIHISLRSTATRKLDITHPCSAADTLVRQFECSTSKIYTTGIRITQLFDIRGAALANRFSLRSRCCNGNGRTYRLLFDRDCRRRGKYGQNGCWRMCRGRTGRLYSTSGRSAVERSCSSRTHQGENGGRQIRSYN